MDASISTLPATSSERIGYLRKLITEWGRDVFEAALTPAPDASTPPSKRKASVASATSAAKRAKPEKSMRDAYRKVEIVPVPNAEYTDQSLQHVVLQESACQLLLAAEAWKLDSDGAPREKLFDMPSDRFVCLPGLDMFVAALNSKGSRLSLDQTHVQFFHLPSGKPCGESHALPIKDDPAPKSLDADSIQHLSADCTRRFPTVLAVTKQMMFLLQPDEGGASLTILATKALPKCCEGGKYRGGANVAVLWHDPSGLPHAILGSKGQALLIPFDNLKSPTVTRKVMLHDAHRRHDSGYVATMRLWCTDGGERKLVSVGGDGCLAVTALDDGVNVSTQVDPEASWTVTSKKHTPCHTVAVYDKAGVAFTGSQFETSGSFWDLRSGKRLCKVASLGEYMRKDKFDIMSTSFSPSGTLAYTNSNDADDDVLKVIRPLALRQ